MPVDGRTAILHASKKSVERRYLREATTQSDIDDRLVGGCEFVAYGLEPDLPQKFSQGFAGVLLELPGKRRLAHARDSEELPQTNLAPEMGDEELYRRLHRALVARFGRE